LALTAPGRQLGQTPSASMGVSAIISGHAAIDDGNC
jgi:hypothetical protein